MSPWSSPVARWPSRSVSPYSTQPVAVALVAHRTLTPSGAGLVSTGWLSRRNGCSSAGAWPATDAGSNRGAAPTSNPERARKARREDLGTGLGGFTVGLLVVTTV